MVVRYTALIVALLATLSACQSVDDMRRAQPRAVYMSAKPAPAIERCLAGSFGWLSAPNIVRNASSTEVFFGPFGNIALHVTLTPVAGGTSVQVRQYLAYGPRSRRTIEACIR